MNADRSARKPVVLTLARLWLFAACARRVSGAGHRDIERLVHGPFPVSNQRMLMIVWVIWSAVWIICALAWKLRCAVIMLTSCSVMSTFEAPAHRTAAGRARRLPAAPRSAWPEPKVSRPVGVTQLLQAVRVGEVRERDLAQRQRASVGEARLHDAGRVGVDADQAAGRVAVLRDRIHREVLLPYCVVSPKS
jgi:hypothetical protein